MKLGLFHECCNQMCFASIQCSKNAIAARALLRTPLGELTALSQPLGDFKGAASGGEGKREKWKEGDGTGREWKKRGREGRKWDGKLVATGPPIG